MSTIFVGQLGLVIELETGADMTLATSKKIYLRSPSGETKEFIATSVGTKLSYTTVDAADLDAEGEWRVMAFISGVGFSLYGATAKFTVSDLFKIV